MATTDTCVEKSECGPIFCIGDSHASFFSGLEIIQPKWPGKSVDVLPFFRSFRVGATLAWSLLSTNSSTGGRESVLTILDRRSRDSTKIVPVGSYVLLAFGEIDCRCHVIPQSEKRNTSIEEIVDRLAERYTTFVGEVAALGFRPLVWNVIPSSPKECAEANELPIIGTPEQRNRAAKALNDRLRRWCDDNDATFVDIYEHLVDADGRTRSEFLMDGYHLSQNAMPFVVRWLESNIPNIVPDGFELPNPDPAAYDNLRFDQSHSMSIVARCRSYARRAAAVFGVR